MGLLGFEIKKTIKQKKYLWVFLILTLVIGGIFSMNVYQRSRQQGRWERWQIMRIVRPFQNKWERREPYLILKRDRQGLKENEEMQLKYSREIGKYLNRLRVAIHFDRNEEINELKNKFLTNLQWIRK